MGSTIFTYEVESNGHLMNRKLLLFPLLVSLAVVSCSDDPSSIASGLLPNGDFPVIRGDTLFATQHSSGSAIVSNRSSGRLLLGIAGIDNGAQVKAWTMLRFLQFPDSLAGVTITGASIELTSCYHFGEDSLAALSFSVHEATSSWLGDSLTVDSLDQTGSYLNSDPLESVSRSALADTDTLRFELRDTSLVREWIRAASDTTAKNEGIILRPSNSSLVKGFWSFNSMNSSNYPRLIIRYSKDGVDGTYTHSTGNSRYCAAAPAAGVITDTSRIFIQNGVSYRGMLTFNIDSIPRSAIINQAYLDVTLDPLHSTQTGLAVDSLYAVMLSQDGSLISDSFELSRADGSGSSRVYSFNVRAFVQTWLLATTVPRRMALIGYDELGTLDIVALYGTAAANNLRPRLRVVYSTSKQ
jgi:hypothetical protein